MGRVLKRVPLDFQWPIGQLWKGYVCPYSSSECKSCESTGLNPETKKISDDWYSFDNAKWIQVTPNKRYNDLAWSNHITQDEVDALVKSNRLYNFTHTFIGDQGWVKKDPEYIPTAEEVNNWNRNGGFGHDSINRWVCVKARAKRLGVYGKCKFCDDGEIWHSKEIKKLSENWDSFDPPTGKGFQLWNTTTEGHPMSPVFESLELLCEWLEPNATIFGSDKISKEEWFRMLGDGTVMYKVGNNVFI